MSNSARSAKYDPDVIAALEDELEVQLRSLDDLTAEFEAGDMDQADYETLRNDYTVRVADTMRRLDHQKDLVEQRPRRFSPLVLVALVVFAAGAGWLLARSTGERGVNDILTGNIESTRQRVFDCQELAAEGQVVEALRCLDGVLLEDPDNPEALTYRGWYLILTIPSAEAAGEDEQAAELLDTGLTYLDRAVEIDPAFPDARAFRSVVYDRMGDSVAACTEVATLVSLDPPPFFVQQTRAIVDRNGCI
ncbi:MAG: tetratricopeptide repeat protein [Acidimicrobiales bacterium]